MGILGAIATIQVSIMIKNTKQRADEAVLYTLNESTRLLKSTDNSEINSALEYLDNDEDRLDYLYQEGYISEVPVPQIDTNKFVYNIDVKQWMIDGKNTVYTETPEKYFEIEGSKIVNYNIDGGVYVVIPKEINDVKITEIGRDAFRGIGIKTVVIQDGIEKISGNAFQYNSLTSVIISDSVEIIYHNSFNNNEIETLVIGNSVKEIKDGAFANNSLTNVILPDSVTSVGSGAFGYGNNFIVSISVGSNVEIGNSHSFGWYGGYFLNYYNENKQGGNYTYENRSWSK